MCGKRDQRKNCTALEKEQQLSLLSLECTQSQRQKHKLTMILIRRLPSLLYFIGRGGIIRPVRPSSKPTERYLPTRVSLLITPRSAPVVEDDVEDSLSVVLSLRALRFFFHDIFIGWFIPIF